MTAAAAPAPNPAQAGRNPWLIAGAMILPTFMVALDTSVANVALPRMAASLSATAHETTAVLTGYLVANAIMLPATGWLAQHFGRKRFLIANIVLFTLASIVCGAAWSLPVMVLARVLQGASGGALLPVAQAVVLESFPAGMRGEAMAAYGLGVIVAPIIGPTLGGWITDSYSWRWLFYINVPVGVVAVVLAQMLIEDPPYIRNAARRGIDYFGFLAMAIGLGSLQILLDSGQRHQWFASAWIRGAAMISVLTLGTFLLWERRARQPVVDLTVLRDRNFGFGFIMAGVYGFILYASLVMLPLFLQGLMGHSALHTGLAITPRGLGALVSMVLAGRLIRRLDGRILIVLGFLMLGGGSFLLAQLTLASPITAVVAPNLIMGAAMGFIFVPMTTMAVASLPLDKIGTATGLYNLMRNLGGSVGIALTTTLLARGAQRHQGTLVSQLGAAPHAADVYHHLVQQAAMLSFVDSYYVLAALAMVGIPLGLMLRRPARTVTETSPAEKQEQAMAATIAD